VLRISAGFCPTENLRAAQEHLDKIQKLINEVKANPIPCLSLTASKT